jgi:hypothetical protein
MRLVPINDGFRVENKGCTLGGVIAPTDIMVRASNLLLYAYEYGQVQ